MKKFLIIVLVWASSYSASAQSQEAQQLLLNWEKLTQLKAILENMYEGYQVVSKGYNTIKDISQGNYSLHQVFFRWVIRGKSCSKKIQAGCRYYCLPAKDHAGT